MAQAEDKKSCFVIAPIGEEGSPERERSDQVFDHIITPVAEQLGYEATRADEIAEPGVITVQVIQRLLDDDLVVADLTGHNANVFYELAVRHMIKKPTVQIISKGERLPFDVAQARTIPLDHTNLNSVEECKNELASQIRAVEGDSSQVDNPISISVDLQGLRSSDNPLAMSVAEIMVGLQEIRSYVQDLRPSGSLRMEDRYSLVELNADLVGVARSTLEFHTQLQSAATALVADVGDPQGRPVVDLLPQAWALMHDLIQVSERFTDFVGGVQPHSR